MMKKIITRLLTICLLLNISFADVIKNYHVDITVLKDGTIDVVETIEMDIDHKDVRLGIIRDIPRYYRLYQKKVETPLRVLSVTRNGESEEYRVVRLEHEYEIHTGSRANHENYYIPQGLNTYKIHWQSENHIRGFMNYDELYFNAIGNDWQLAIEKATATMHLTESAKITKISGYYGHYGSTKLADISQKSPGIVEFSVPKPIGQGQGLTVEIGFEKGVISSIPANRVAELVEKILSDYPDYVHPIHVALALFVIIFFIYWCITLMIYRSREVKSQRAFMVRFSPPNLGLDQIIVLSNERYGNFLRRFNLAFLVDLASKKAIEFQESKKNISINPYQKKLHAEELTQGQLAFLSELEEKLDGEASYAKYNTILVDALNSMSFSLQKYGGKYYQSLVAYTGLSRWVLFIACMIFTMQFISGVTYLLLPFAAAATLAMMQGIIGFCRSLLSFVKERSLENFLNLIQSCFVYAFYMAFGLFWSIVVFSFIWGNYYDDHLYASVLGVALLTMFFSILLIFSHTIIRSIKPEYIEDQQQVLEFKHFLQYTKETEYQMITPDIFEEYLPYAIIFGVSKNWLGLYQKLHPNEYVHRQTTSSMTAYSITTSRSFNTGTVASSSRSGGSGSRGRGFSGGGSGGGGGRGR